VELDERGTVLDCAVAMTGMARPQAQHLLGKFLFSGYAEQEKQVSVLSGGERRRLALAAIVASGANFLVLDEPTNHLDLESREALEAALEAFPGSILLVSHDRALLDAVAERTVAVEEHKLHSYEGGWADLVQAREERTTEPKPEPAAKEPKAPRPAAKKKGPTELEQVERRITTLEQHVAQLEAKLAEDWTNMDMLTEYRTSRDELQELLERWEALFETA
jgi:ATP-binding cassette, subfamily F, member 3